MGNYTYIEQGDLGEVFNELHNSQIFGLDLETTGFKPIDSKIILCQLGFPNGNNYVINTSRVSIQPLKMYFQDKHWLKIIQNAKFEGQFLKYHNDVTFNGLFDTMLAESLITSQLYGTSLKALAKKYLDMELNKEVRGTFGAVPIGAFSSEQLDYAAKDAEILFPIYEQQQKLLKEKGLLGVADLEFDVSQVVAQMEITGVPINGTKWMDVWSRAKEEHEISRLKLHEIFLDGTSKVTEQLGIFTRDSINFNSPKQVKEALNSIGIAVTATNERELEKIDHPATKELLNYRGLQKIVSSYGTSFLDQIHPFTGRIHPEFSQIGTQTGRFSCKEPNFQQVPPDFRECVMDERYSVIAADYSQIELRILAELSDDPNFIRAFESGEDLHKATAAIMFNKPITSISKDERFWAKTINFGLAYGMGITKLKDTINANSERKISFGQSKELINKYKTTFSKAIFWLQDTGYAAYRNGYSETMMGRKRFFSRPAQGIEENDYDKQVASIKRQGANAPIQGTNADMTKMAMKDIHREIKNYYPASNIIIQVHDEIVLLARKEEAESISILVRDSMIEAAQKFLKKVPVKVETFVGDYWSK